MPVDWPVEQGEFPRTMGERKSIALIAHDNRKADLLDWARFNRIVLGEHDLYATGTTGSLLESELGLSVTCFRSGPLGGDQQVGAKVTEGELDFVIFFWDPLQPQPHDVDVKALLRIAVVYNIPIACNRSSADFMVSSPLMSQRYERRLVDYEHRIHPAADTRLGPASPGDPDDGLVAAPAGRFDDYPADGFWQ